MHILAITDMSARSDRAVRRAADLAVQQGATLCVLHVVDDAAPEDLTAQIVARAEVTLRRFVASLPGGDAAQVRVIAGDPTAEVLDTVERGAPDLLVLGRHRERSFLGALRETTAGRIARLTHCPVLMVADRVDHGYDAVVAATDFSPGAAAAIALAATLNPDAKITPVHAYHVPYAGLTSRLGGTEDLEASFEAEARALDAKWRASSDLPETCTATTILPGSPLEVLSAEMARTGAMLITAGAHGRVGQGRAVLGSVAADLLRCPPTDILIVRPD